MPDAGTHEPHDGMRLRPSAALRGSRNLKPPLGPAVVEDTGFQDGTGPQQSPPPPAPSAIWAVAAALYKHKWRITALAFAAAGLASIYGLLQPARHAITTVLEIGRAQPEQDGPLEQPQNALVRLKAVDIPAALASLYSEDQTTPMIAVANSPKSNAITLTSYATAADTDRQIRLHQAIAKALLDAHGRMLQPIRDRIASSLRLGAIEMKSSVDAANNRKRPIEDRLADARSELGDLRDPVTIARKDEALKRRQQSIARQLAALKRNSAAVTDRLKQAEIEQRLLTKNIEEMERVTGELRAGKVGPVSSDLLLQATQIEMNALPLQQRLLVGIPSAVFDLQNSLAAITDQQLALTETGADLEQQIAGLPSERAKQQELLAAKLAGIGYELDAAKADAQRVSEVAGQKQADLQASLDSALPTRVMIAPRLSAQPAGLRWWQLGLLAGLGTALAAVLLLWARQALADFTGGQGLKAWLLARGLVARSTAGLDPSSQPANALAA